ncbi:MAG: ferritin [Pseudonocardia sediminis]
MDPEKFSGYHRRVSEETKFPAMLRDQIRNEFTASQQYAAVAVYLDDEDLPQLAAHFYAQALEERNHAMSMVQYLLDSDHRAVIPAVDEVRNEFSSVEDVVSLALSQEKTVTEQITALARTARDEGDYLGEQFMQWFLKEQVEEVASMSTLLTVVRRAGDNLFHIEDFVNRELTKAAAPDTTAPPVAGGRV